MTSDTRFVNLITVQHNILPNCCCLGTGSVLIQKLMLTFTLFDNSVEFLFGLCFSTLVLRNYAVSLKGLNKLWRLYKFWLKPFNGTKFSLNLRMQKKNMCHRTSSQEKTHYSDKPFLNV